MDAKDNQNFTDNVHKQLCALRDYNTTNVKQTNEMILLTALIKA